MENHSNPPFCAKPAGRAYPFNVLWPIVALFLALFP